MAIIDKKLATKLGAGQIFWTKSVTHQIGDRLVDSKFRVTRDTGAMIGIS